MAKAGNEILFEAVSKVDKGGTQRTQRMTRRTQRIDYEK